MERHAAKTAKSSATKRAIPTEETSPSARGSSRVSARCTESSRRDVRSTANAIVGLHANSLSAIKRSSQPDSAEFEGNRRNQVEYWWNKSAIVEHIRTRTCKCARESGECAGPVAGREGLRGAHEVVQALSEQLTHDARVGTERAERVLHDELDVQA